MEMFVFEERGKQEYPEKNLSEQGRESTTNSTHIWRRVRESNPGQIGGRQALSPLHHPYKNHAVEEAKRKSKFVPRQNPSLKDLLLKMPLGKLSFLHTLFLENQAQNDRQGMMLFMSKQVSLPKISLNLWELAQKSEICLFCSKAFNKNFLQHTNHSS